MNDPQLPGEKDILDVTSDEIDHAWLFESTLEGNDVYIEDSDNNVTIPTMIESVKDLQNKEAWGQFSGRLHRKSLTE